MKRETKAPAPESVTDAIRSSWTQETSVDDTWDPSKPEKGQCAVSALVVQDYFGGELRRAIVEGVSHYWNILPDGSVVDLTRQQFGKFEPIDEIKRDRDYVLRFPDTQHRYRLLRTSVDRVLNEPKAAGS